MHRVDTANNVANQFDDGDPVVPRPPTTVDAAILNALQNELVNTIEGAGITLVKGTNTQLLAAVRALIAEAITPGGRLTLATGTPVTTTDQTGKTTVYYTPFKNDQVVLWNGTTFAVRTFTELSQATTDATKSPAAVAANKVYDMFVWLDGSTLRCTRGPAWTSDTVRGTGAGTSELELLNGKYVNKVAVTNGPAARFGLYVGSVRSDGSSQINDSAAKRHVWNRFEKVQRFMRVLDTTETWAYASTTIRQANGAAANQLDFLRGLDEDSVEAHVQAFVAGAAVLAATAALGLDSTSAFLADQTARGFGTREAAAGYDAVGSDWVGLPGVGRHLLTWLECAGGGSPTWLGRDISGSNVFVQSGIWATFLG